MLPLVFCECSGIFPGEFIARSIILLKLARAVLWGGDNVVPSRWKGMDDPATALVFLGVSMSDSDINLLPEGVRCDIEVRSRTLGVPKPGLLDEVWIFWPSLL